MTLRAIHTDSAPTPAGHYSQAIEHQGVIYVAGQLPIGEQGRAAPHGTIEEQTIQCLRNVEAILEAAGSGLERVLQMTVYIADIELWPQVNAAYADIMGDHRPARAVVPVPELHHGYLIEIQAQAAV